MFEICLYLFPVLIKHSKLSENTHPPTFINPADLTGDLSQLFCHNLLAYCPYFVFFLLML